LAVSRHTRVVARKLEDGAIRTYDIYRILQDRSLITRHGSPLYITEPLIGDNALIPRHGSPGILQTYDPRALMDDRFLLTRHGSPLFVTTPLVADKAVTTAKGSPLFVTAGLMAGRAITQDKLTALPQAGSAVVAGYFTYPTAYAAVKGAAACPITPVGGYPDVGVSRLLAGSCYVAGGSPAQYARVMVYGDV